MEFGFYYKPFEVGLFAYNTVVQQLARFKLTLRMVRSLGDSGASCRPTLDYVLPQLKSSLPPVYRGFYTAPVDGRCNDVNALIQIHRSHSWQLDRLILYNNSNKWSKSFDIIPHRLRTRTVQSYSPGGAIVPPCNTCFLRPTESTTQTASRSIQLFLRSSRKSVVAGHVLSPKIAPSHGIWTLI